MALVEEAAVFYFDVLGFSGLARQSREAAIDALTDLAALLEMPAILTRTERWQHRYALSDSVFLTHTDPVRAVAQAGDLMFNLLHYNAAHDRSTLIRGGLAFGEIEHVRGIFLPALEGPGNLVGAAVEQAVRLERRGKGPRIFVSSDLTSRVRAQDPQLADWLLRGCLGAGVFELLWLLPASGFASLVADLAYIRDVCELALRLLSRHGGDPAHGAHYREFALLTARSLLRVAEHCRTGGSLDAGALAALWPLGEVERACRTPGLPVDFVGALLEAARQLENPPAAPR
jgi:hypothetical protein